MLLNRHGLYDRNTTEKLAGETEEEIYEILGKPFKEPKNREV